MKKFTDILLGIFAVGVLFTLFAGALSLVGYIVAIFIGGEIATKICQMVFKEYFPWVIRICSISVGLGLIGMYLGKMRALTMNTEDEK